VLSIEPAAFFGLGRTTAEWEAFAVTECAPYKPHCGDIAKVQKAVTDGDPQAASCCLYYAWKTDNRALGLKTLRTLSAAQQNTIVASGREQGANEAFLAWIQSLDKSKGMSTGLVVGLTVGIAAITGGMLYAVTRRR
jgi:hypothetical protein